MNESLPLLLLRWIEGGEPAYFLGLPELSPAAGKAFARLLELGAVVHDRLLDTWTPCTNCDCGADERAIRWVDGVPTAVCPISCEEDERLDPGELQLFRIGLNRFVELVSNAAALSGRPEEVAPSLWRLGRIASGRILLLATASSAVRGPGAFDRLRAIDKSARFTAIAAVASAAEVSLLSERGIDVVAPEEAFLPSEPGQPVRLNLERLIAGIASSDPDLLEINPMALAAAFGGRALQLEPRDFRVLLILVREANDGDAAATRDDLYRALVGGDHTIAPIGDEQVDKSISRIRRALCEARGLPRSMGTDLIVAIRGHGYRLVTAATRILIR